MDADVIVVGAGLAGIVAATELAARGKRVALLDQEGPQSLGGQAFWSLGGLFMIDTPEQRRLRIRDSAELALADWMGSAGFDRPEDHWPEHWARAYLEFASGEMRDWLHGMGTRWFPVVGWAERGGAAPGHGNSVPRFHITWGTGPGVLAPFLARLAEHEATGRIARHHRHRVTDLERSNGRVAGVAGEILAESTAERGASSGREVTGAFRMQAEAVVVTSGGIGGNMEAVRRHWPAERLGPAPETMISGVPDHVDGMMIEATERAGGHVINADRMWHYTEGVRNYAPIWPGHGIRILPGPSSMWLDAEGERLPAPCLPGFDTLSTLREIRRRGHDHSWFVLTRTILEKEFAFSGSEQNPDLTSARWTEVLKSRFGKGGTTAARNFLEHGPDFVKADTLEELAEAMNRLGEGRIDPARLRAQVEARDAQLGNPFCKDLQITAIRGARTYIGDRLIRTAKPHRLLDPAHGPLVAVKLHLLTRKSLGGLQTDLDGRVLDAAGEPVGGLYAAGEAAGFGGGGVHGYNALEGTFLGGCLHSGRRVGRAI